MLSGALTLQGIGLLDGQWDAQKRKSVLQNVFSSRLLLYELINLSRLLEGSRKPEGKQANVFMWFMLKVVSLASLIIHGTS